VARVLSTFVESERPCVYLPGERARQDVRVMVDVGPEEYERLLERGYRRFGAVYFRPACTACGECRSIRVPVETFQPSQAQRRARKACADLRVELGPPRVDDERLALFARWHAAREVARGWDPSPTDRDSYFQCFAFPHVCARELAFYDDAPEAGGKLVAIAIADETPRAWSAVYCFYDPAYARRSVGVASVLLQIELARGRGVPHVYLGYRVAGCASLAYKARYAPHELLIGRPGDDEPAIWAPP
jgi:arginine-tRNA-protein transferase